MKILKFGGSSVATPERIRQVARIVETALGDGPVALVVSAFGGVTNDLLAAARAAAARDEGYATTHSALENRHLEAARELAPAELEELESGLRERFVDLHDLLHGIYLLREASLRTLDAVLAYGELLSAELVAAALRAAGLDAWAADARRFVVTDATFGNAQVDCEATCEAARAALARQATAVVTGFVAATPDGRTTTLGRGGSDYTAALLGAALGADAVELWTDVDGVLSADPRLVEGAFPLPLLSYPELMELSHFGAKVVYPPSIHPARGAGIPLLIKNTLNPSAEGTRVQEEAPPSEHPIRGISSINRVALARLEGDGMVGVPGIAMRLFGALARMEVSVILISQSSSEHSICFAVSPEDAERARDAVDREFALERRAGLVEELVVEEELAIIAAVGEEMRRRPGLAGRVFGVLGDHGISVRAIAQGSSELNISLVVEGQAEARAVRAMHDAFFVPRRRRISLAIAGTGRVGGELLAQLRETAPRLAERDDLELRVVALAGSRRMLVDRDGIDLGRWRQRLDDDGDALDPERLKALLRQPTGALRILADCTASPELAGWYEELLEAGVAVVAANKHPFAGPLELYRRLRRAARRGQAGLYHEATVGAGLPVLKTLSELVTTGDRVERIDGVLSGTVSSVLERVAAGGTLSEAVRGAYADGLTEPHPYEDLSGGDVARKLAILARLADQPLELEDIDIEPLIAAVRRPGDGWEAMDLESFWRELPRLDEEFGRRQREAADGGRRLRYVASLAAGRARVALEAVPPSHAAYSASGPDNLIAFTTARYHETPLVIRGPGAGPVVTAGGVFADVLRAAGELDRRRGRGLTGV